ncbi:MAG: HDOD domain-containing protein [Candidatus Magnetoovum sp. WYHC-5]|nr:HDOD domain-containing protein [Candidatus Magnetoovum sp. WYHC-5]
MPLKILIIESNRSDSGLIKSFFVNAFPRSNVYEAQNKELATEIILKEKFAMIVFEVESYFYTVNEITGIIREKQPFDIVLVLVANANDTNITDYVKDKKNIFFVPKPIRYSKFSEHIMPYLEQYIISKEPVGIGHEEPVTHSVTLKEEKHSSQQPIDKHYGKLAIPPQPKIVLDVNREIQKPYPDFKSLSELVKLDVFMSARILKIANSPYYGVGKVDSILTALNILGLDNFRNLVVSVALKSALEKWGVFDEKFWAHSVSVASICDTIAKRQCTVNNNLAYLAGLFHDSAVPILLKRFSTYKDVFDMAIGNTPNVNNSENMIFKTNHCMLSSLIVKTWGLPAPLYTAIKNHHKTVMDFPKHTTDDIVTYKLWAAIVTAEQLCGHYGTVCSEFFKDEESWAAVYGKALEELEIDIDSLKDIRSEAFYRLDNLDL